MSLNSFSVKISLGSNSVEYSTEYSIVLKLFDDVAREKQSVTLVSEVSQFHTKGIEARNSETPDTRTLQPGKFKLYRTKQDLLVGF